MASGRASSHKLSAREGMLSTPKQATSKPYANNRQRRRHVDDQEYFCFVKIRRVLTFLKLILERNANDGGEEKTPFGGT